MFRSLIKSFNVNTISIILQKVAETFLLTESCAFQIVRSRSDVVYNHFVNTMYRCLKETV